MNGVIIGMVVGQGMDFDVLRRAAYGPWGRA
jgi:hypothetical protein